MNKQEFLYELRNGLSGLPQEDIEERLMFYGEMIDDRMEEGATEEDAISDIGSVDEIISQIIAETPFTRLVKEKIRKKRKLNAFEIILLVLGSPIWLSLLCAFGVIILSLYIIMWSVIIVLWSAFISFVACGLCGIAGGIFFAVTSDVLAGIAVIGAGIVCSGLSIFVFLGCREATKGILSLTKSIILGHKKRFVGKETA